jgi:molecular chaperone GrpE (heat shock protein)
VAGLEDAVRTRLADADRAGAVIERLEAEVRRLKRREDERRLEPAVKGVISLFDRIGLVLSSRRDREREMSGPERELTRALTALETQALELIEGLGATALVPQASTPFDGQRQEVLGTVETPDPDKHMTVADVRRPGFEFAGRVCRPAAVYVFKHANDLRSQPKEA